MRYFFASAQSDLLRLMQVDGVRRLQLIKDLTDEMSSVMAAAVHQGLIPIEEMLDLLDSAALPTTIHYANKPVKCSLADKEREWARWTAQKYLNPSIAGPAKCAQHARP